MSVHNLITNKHLSSYNTLDFKRILEQHRAFLLTTSLTTRQIEPKLDVRHRYDFYGLCNALNINADLWWITMRLNDFKNPMDYKGGLAFILVPDETAISNLLIAHLSMK